MCCCVLTSIHHFCNVFEGQNSTNPSLLSALSAWSNTEHRTESLRVARPKMIFTERRKTLIIGLKQNQQPVRPQANPTLLKANPRHLSCSRNMISGFGGLTGRFPQCIGRTAEWCQVANASGGVVSRIESSVRLCNPCRLHACWTATPCKTPHLRC